MSKETLYLFKIKFNEETMYAFRDKLSMAQAMADLGIALEKLGFDYGEDFTLTHGEGVIDPKKKFKIIDGGKK